LDFISAVERKSNRRRGSCERVELFSLDTWATGASIKVLLIPGRYCTGKTAHGKLDGRQVFCPRLPASSMVYQFSKSKALFERAWLDDAQTRFLEIAGKSPATYSTSSPDTPVPSPLATAP